jgi:hypothetical protein
VTIFPFNSTVVRCAGTNPADANRPASTPKVVSVCTDRLYKQTDHFLEFYR